MKKIVLLSFFFVTLFITAQEKKSTYVADHYTKKEVHIKMRDGLELFTTIYSPKDLSKKYPIIMERTPYSCWPYGADEFPESISPNMQMMKEGYIVVYQDVRGRYMSEGTFDNMRPNIPGNDVNNKTAIGRVIF